jgi:hypothetical protein
MTLKTVFAALALSLAPLVATAECYGNHTQATMSCSEGMQWDSEQRVCVPKATS